MSYTTQHLAVFFGRSKATVRNWAVEFADYLSPTATPEEGKVRYFTDEDLKVFALVADYKDRDQTYEQIHLALSSGLRGTPPDLSEQEIQSLSTSERERRIALEVEALQRTIVQLRQELHQTQEKAQKVDEVNLENMRLKTRLELTQQQLEEVRKQTQQEVSHAHSRAQELEQRLNDAIAKYSKRIEELSQQIGREYAKGVMDALREKGELPKED
jgi:DNA-binding transcriptional MerR regulator